MASAKYIYCAKAHTGDSPLQNPTQQKPRPLVIPVINQVTGPLMMCNLVRDRHVN